MTIQVFEVGGCVRSDEMGRPCNDVDLLLVGATSFEAGVAHARKMGLAPINGTLHPEFVSFKAAVPQGHALRERCKTVDFVLARKDGISTDGRRPDSVEPGTLLDDLSRRDFTVNALARNVETGDIVDPFGGLDDIQREVLRFVGDPMERIREDGLRVMRGFRFFITLGFVWDIPTGRALISHEAAEMLERVSVERVREELEKMLKADTPGALRLLGELPTFMHKAIFREGLRLAATLKQ